MKIVVFLFGLNVVLLAEALVRDKLASEWQLYKKIHGKTYNADEDLRRFDIYLMNKEKITEHNEKYESGIVSFRVGVNKFTDRLSEEVRALNGARGDAKKVGIPYVDDGEAVPPTVDWRNKSVVTAVKDQGHCGSCWSFSATGSLEGQHALIKGKLKSLSEQNLMDCSAKYGNKGCRSGMPDWAFNYIRDNGGVDTEKSYPYKAKNGTCKFNSKTVAATVTGHIDLPAGDEIALMNAVAKVGPISVTIDARSWLFHHYIEGVFNLTTCSNIGFDHAVLIVGYGTENGHDYWLVKNSWGPSWGDQGYIKMSRNAENQCGIANHASYPLV